MRWYARPAVHFAALGVALFLGGQALGPADAPADIVVTPGLVAQLRAEFARATGRAAGTDDERVLVDRAIEEEVLYREAMASGFDRGDPSIMFRLTEKMRFVDDVEDGDERPIDAQLYGKAVAMGFDRHDPIVRRILVQKMRLTIARQADLRTPTDDELRGHYETHRERYLRSPRVGFWHVFLGSDGGRGEADAAALLARVRGEALRPEDAARLGDPFPSGVRLTAQSAEDLDKLFGEGFAGAVLALAPGSWQGPVRSAYGLHLVRVETREAERVASFASVRSRVLADLRAERREAHLAEVLRALRERYAVRYADAAGRAG